MGIRVKKMLGYGLTNVKPDDPRINWVGLDMMHDLDVKDYLEWLNAGNGIDNSERHLLGHSLSHNEKINLYGCVVHDSEYGLSNVLCLRPTWLTDWYRSDDAIDWVEETYLKAPRNENGEAWVRTLRVSPYPFSGAYMDSRTGVRLGPEVLSWMRVRNAIDDESIQNEMCALFGMTYKQARRYVVPLVPDEIRNLAMFTGLFTSPDTWMQLRPMVYCWWS